MKKRKFKAIIYLISFTVFITVGIQVYRNVQNYNLNKQRFINDVQVALDNGVEGYFSSLAKNFVFLDRNDSGAFDASEIKAFFQNSIKGKASDSLKKFQFSTNTAVLSDTSIGGVTIRSTGKGDSNVQLRGVAKLNNGVSIRNITVSKDTISSTRLNELEAFTTKVMISMVQDTIDFKNLTQYVKKELGRKKIDIDFAFASLQNNEVVELSREFRDDEFSLSTLSKASYLPKKELKMYFDNASLIILKRGMVDLLISLLISVSVIGSLLYLYRIINQQKQLAEIKNDLISNITHEFKTPIATVTSALEGIANFNKQNDPEKTAKYLDMSNDQLKKLNLMVEKLLETATLDSDELSLRKEPVNLTLLLSSMIEKYKMLAGNKRLAFVAPTADVIIEADPFHLENALSNLVDNAIKYGGNEIQVILTKLGNRAQVVVQDNGGYIEKTQKERVFDKFYRIPTGNQHDVKGFGIGLYYTRKIIEKHGGSIDLVLKPQLTSFEVAFS
ncbi:sensor histidine kinase [Roseivirga seohaensis]|uniref:sensor histidine kinase n=1 Tax=Roseivirga seohaensis TaxID=1914963 RepID=UPI003BAA0207